MKKKSTKTLTATTTSPPLWWESLSDDVECAITLEPINSLPYPPFLLRKSTTSTEGGVIYYFDGRSLASYIVSRGIFQNPLTRDPLSWEDCRRLDDYLQEYSPTQQFQVLEAFALRQSVQVRTAAAPPEFEDSRQRRAEFLRSEATAALTGLFDYHSNNPRQQGRRRAQSSQSSASASHNNSQQESSPPVFGFNLHHQPPSQTTSTTNDFGMVVIDDDDAVRVESDQAEYQQLQEAFPRLSTQTQGPNNITPIASTDQLALQHIKSQAEQDRFQELVRQQALEWARQQLALEAQQRLEAKQVQRHVAKEQAAQAYQREQQEEQEIARARAEIEAWRESQWARLRQTTEQQQLEEQEQQSKQQQLSLQRQEEEKEAKLEEQEELLLAAQEEEEEEKLAKQKAAKAAKRKRAKERKKAQKAEERQLAQEKEQQAALQAQKQASRSKCAACKGGILGCGFEKFGHHFCSTPCARAGPSDA